jgi:hypothetical protein
MFSWQSYIRDRLGWYSIWNEAQDYFIILILLKNMRTTGAPYVVQRYDLSPKIFHSKVGSKTNSQFLGAE